MAQHRPPDTFGDLPLIQTPVIDIQGLEHRSKPNSRKSNTDLKIEPTIKDDDALDFTQEDAAVIEALEEFEKSIRERPPS
jgi:hypothetical protein